MELDEISHPFPSTSNFFQEFQSYFLAKANWFHLSKNSIFDFEATDTAKAPMVWFTVRYSSTLLVTELIVISLHAGIPKIFLAYKTDEDRDWVLYKENGTKTVREHTFLEYNTFSNFVISLPF